MFKDRGDAFCRTTEARRLHVGGPDWAVRSCNFED